MNIFQCLRLAIKSIIANKMRSLLTMLGMIIGVAAVIIIMGLMNGVTNYMISSFSDLGTNTITVSVSSNGNRKVTIDDMYELINTDKDLFMGVTPNTQGNFTTKNGTESISSVVTGVSEDYDKINSIALSEGRFVNYADILTRQRTCVIGTYIISELFDNNNVIGKEIKINGESFTIVGIVEETEDGEKNSADHCIYAPYSKVLRMTGMTTVSSYTVAVHDMEMVNGAIEIIEKHLYDILGDEDSYSTMSLLFILNMVSSIMSMISLVLSGIAGISLLVAGIGIMNIMLVSVTERTKEIGIRKSLGAKRKHILLQFIIEASSVSALGGIIGIILGCVVVMIIAKVVDLDAAPTLSAILISFGISVSIGVLFGYMPAKRAATLNPIDALRSE